MRWISCEMVKVYRSQDGYEDKLEEHEEEVSSPASGLAWPGLAEQHTVVRGRWTRAHGMGPSALMLS